jgi:hypothetical protein
MEVVAAAVSLTIDRVVLDNKHTQLKRVKLAIKKAANAALIISQGWSTQPNPTVIKPSF